jgi:hypothetical protein
MEHVYSKVDTSKLLHIVYNLNEVTDRIDLIPEDNFLQCSVVRKNAGKKFQTHKHNKSLKNPGWFLKVKLKFGITILMIH